MNGELSDECNTTSVARHLSQDIARAANVNRSEKRYVGCRFRLRWIAGRKNLVTELARPLLRKLDATLPRSSGFLSRLGLTLRRLWWVAMSESLPSVLPRRAGRRSAPIRDVHPVPAGGTSSIRNVPSFSTSMPWRSVCSPCVFPSSEAKNSSRHFDRRLGSHLSKSTGSRGSLGSSQSWPWTLA